MKRFKFIGQFNWKYVIGEILLIFFGINLAIWFNNWNASKQAGQSKLVALAKIEEEIGNNARELEIALENAVSISGALSRLQLAKLEDSQILSTPDGLRLFQQEYPGFFSVTDSTLRENGQYLYGGRLSIVLELPSLTQIAWETTKTINILSEFSYECLYQLESMYDLQGRVLEEMDLAARALQARDLWGLQRSLQFLHQLELALQEDYRGMLETIAACS
ncbi:MAG: hypothetical protein KDC32_21690 [Saprospiraceae bacterium]|nr:hypothetical protein [Saprospiraceae bacterium]MCB0675613.1 hypothetical protein [Saprospiraceae bacterium]MCB0683490.1 hypothetical protein [Saprospiraceae bacterium]